MLFAVEQYISQFLSGEKAAQVCDGPTLLQDTQHCCIWKTLHTNSQTMQLCVPVQGMWLAVFPGVSQLWVVHGTPRIRSAPWVFISAWLFGPFFHYTNLEVLAPITGAVLFCWPPAQIKHCRYTRLEKGFLKCSLDSEVFLASWRTSKWNPFCCKFLRQNFKTSSFGVEGTSRCFGGTFSVSFQSGANKNSS